MEESKRLCSTPLLPRPATLPNVDERKLTLMGQHMVESGTPKLKVLEMLRMLNDTNDATIRSPRVRALASQRLMAVYTAFEAT